MVKKKTSLMMDENTWKAFTVFTIQMTGPSRKTSEFVEYALKAYMVDPNLDPGFGGESIVESSSLSNPDLCRTLKERKKEGYDIIMWRIWKK
jgi:hypothetical protein